MVSIGLSVLCVFASAKSARALVTKTCIFRARFGHETARGELPREQARHFHTTPSCCAGASLLEIVDEADKVVHEHMYAQLVT
eukprot:5454028-Amphidinium_carterae.1